MKEGAIIHRYGANSVLRNMMTVTTNDGHFWICKQITGLCPAPFRLPCYGVTLVLPHMKEGDKNSLSAFFH